MLRTCRLVFLYFFFLLLEGSTTDAMESAIVGTSSCIILLVGVRVLRGVVGIMEKALADQQQQYSRDRNSAFHRRGIIINVALLLDCLRDGARLILSRFTQQNQPRHFE